MYMQKERERGGDEREGGDESGEKRRRREMKSILSAGGEWRVERQVNRWEN